MTRAKVRSWAVNAAALVFFSGVAFAAGEIAVRLMFAGRINLFPRYHTSAQYGDIKLRTIRPNEVFWHTSADGSWRFETNAQGFRNVEDFEHAKPPGVVRVLVLGDSHTQGYEVRQDRTYSAVIERYLESRGYDAEVLNTGVSGFSTAEALLFLENEGIKYRPDFVVLGFYKNDFEDNTKAGLFRLKDDGSLELVKNEHLPGVRIQDFIYSVPFVDLLSENSYFYSMLFNGAWEFFKARLTRNAAEAVTEYAVSMKEEHSEYEKELGAALLERMRRFCAARGIPLIVVDIPTMRGAPSWPADMRARMAALSDAYVDGSSALRYRGAVELHLPNGDHHISEFTHAVLGTEVAEIIAERLRAAEDAEPMISKVPESASGVLAR